MTSQGALRGDERPHDAAIVRTKRVLWPWHRMPRAMHTSVEKWAVQEGLRPASTSRDALQGELS